MAEPIDLPLGLWTRERRRKHKFNRVRQVAPMCPHGHIGATWRIRVNRPSAAAIWPYVKLLQSLLVIRPHRSTIVRRCGLLLPTEYSVAVCQSVGRSVTVVSRAKTAEPIEMPSGLRTRLEPITIY